MWVIERIKRLGSPLDDLKERGVIGVWVSDGNHTTNAIFHRLVSDASFTKWKMCSRMCPTNSVNRLNQS